MKVKVILNQWHLKTIEWAISDSLWICESNRRSFCNFTRPWLYLPLSICINCRTLAWEGVYVYKLAFFFWLSPRTYHFLFEKRLIIDWRYFWQNIALSMILERSPDYPLNTDQVLLLSSLTFFYRSYCPLIKFSFPHFSMQSSDFDLKYVKFELICFYAPAIKWPGHILLPLSIIPSFRHSGFSFRSLSKSYIEIFKWNLVHRFVTRIRRLSSNLGLVE